MNPCSKDSLNETGLSTGELLTHVKVELSSSSSGDDSSDDSETEAGSCAADISRFDPLSDLIKTEISNETVELYDEGNETIDNFPLSDCMTRGNKIYSCKYCGYQVKRIAALKRHEERHLDGTCKCRFCDFSSSIPHHLKAHELKHKGTLHQCQYCSYKTRHRKDLNKHKRVHFAVKKFACHMCPFQCKWKRNLEVHLTRHFEDRPYTCKECGLNFKLKSGLQTHKKIHRKIKPYSCDECSFRCRTNYELKSHKYSHSDMRRFPCTFPGCDQKCKTKSDLSKHISRHLNKRKFKCCLCQKAFNCRRDIQTHLMIHISTGKSFCCATCGKVFDKKVSLLRHMKMHTTQRRFMCSICGHLFRAFYNMKNHMKVHEEGREFRCPFCIFGALTADGLTTHIGHMHLNEYTYFCELCLKPFGKLQNLKLHIERCHSGLSEDKHPKFIYNPDCCEHMPLMEKQPSISGLKTGLKTAVQEKNVECSATELCLPGCVATQSHYENDMVKIFDDGEKREEASITGCNAHESQNAVSDTDHYIKSELVDGFLNSMGMFTSKQSSLHQWDKIISTNNLELASQSQQNNEIASNLDELPLQHEPSNQSDKDAFTNSLVMFLSQLQSVDEGQAQQPTHQNEESQTIHQNEGLKSVQKDKDINSTQHSGLEPVKQYKDQCTHPNQSVGLHSTQLNEELKSVVENEELQSAEQKLGQHANQHEREQCTQQFDGLQCSQPNDGLQPAKQKSGLQSSQQNNALFLTKQVTSLQFSSQNNSSQPIEDCANPEFTQQSNQHPIQQDHLQPSLQSDLQSTVQNDQLNTHQNNQQSFLQNHPQSILRDDLQPKLQNGLQSIQQNVSQPTQQSDLHSNLENEIQPILQGDLQSTQQNELQCAQLYDSQSIQQSESQSAQQRDPKFSQQNDLLYAQQRDPQFTQQNDLLYAQQGDPQFTQQNDLLSAVQADLQFTQQNDLLSAQQGDPQFTQQNDLLSAVQADLQFTQQIDPQCAHLHDSLASQHSYPLATQEGDLQSIQQNDPLTAQQSDLQPTQQSCLLSMQQNNQQFAQQNDPQSTQKNEPHSAQQRDPVCAEQNDPQSIQQNGFQSTTQQSDPLFTHQKDLLTIQKKDSQCKQQNDSPSTQDRDSSSIQGRDPLSNHQNNTQITQRNDPLSDLRRNLPTIQEIDKLSTQQNHSPFTQQRFPPSPQQRDLLSKHQNNPPSTQKRDSRPIQQTDPLSNQQRVPWSSQQNEPLSTQHNDQESTQENDQESTQQNDQESTQENDQESTQENDQESTQQNDQQSTQQNDQQSTQENDQESSQENYLLSVSTHQKATLFSTKTNGDQPSQKTLYHVDCVSHDYMEHPVPKCEISSLLLSNSSQLEMSLEKVPTNELTQIDQGSSLHNATENCKIGVEFRGNIPHVVKLGSFAGVNICLASKNSNIAFNYEKSGKKPKTWFMEPSVMPAKAAKKFSEYKAKLKHSSKYKSSKTRKATPLMTGRQREKDRIRSSKEIKAAPVFHTTLDENEKINLKTEKHFEEKKQVIRGQKKAKSFAGNSLSEKKIVNISEVQPNVEVLINGRKKLRICSPDIETTSGEGKSRNRSGKKDKSMSSKGKIFPIAHLQPVIEIFCGEDKVGVMRKNDEVLSPKEEVFIKKEGATNGLSNRQLRVAVCRVDQQNNCSLISHALPCCSAMGRKQSKEHSETHKETAATKTREDYVTWQSDDYESTCPKLNSIHKRKCVKKDVDLTTTTVKAYSARTSVDRGLKRKLAECSSSTPSVHHTHNHHIASSIIKDCSVLLQDIGTCSDINMKLSDVKRRDICDKFSPSNQRTGERIAEVKCSGPAEYAQRSEHKDIIKNVSVKLRRIDKIYNAHDTFTTLSDLAITMPNLKEKGERSGKDMFHQTSSKHCTRASHCKKNESESSLKGKILKYRPESIVQKKSSKDNVHILTLEDFEKEQSKKQKVVLCLVDCFQKNDDGVSSLKDVRKSEGKYRQIKKEEKKFL